MIISMNVSSEDGLKWFAQLPEKLQKIAQYRFDRCKELYELSRGRPHDTLALYMVCSEHEISHRTLLDWYSLVGGEPSEEWLPQLVPTFKKTGLDLFLDGKIACPCCGEE